jgi:hypothetical protein
MNKHFIILLIVIMSQFKNNKRLILIKKEIANINNFDQIKNLKNYKRTFSTKNLKANLLINEGLNNDFNLNKKNNFLENYLTKINNIFRKKNLFDFDFNSINLLFFGCCNLI